jgi:hypothetical protein
MVPGDADQLIAVEQSKAVTVVTIYAVQPLLVCKRGFAGVIAAEHAWLQLEGFEANSPVKLQVFGQEAADAVWEGRRLGHGGKIIILCLQ